VWKSVWKGITQHITGKIKSKQEYEGRRTNWARLEKISIVMSIEGVDPLDGRSQVPHAAYALWQSNLRRTVAHAQIHRSPEHCSFPLVIFVVNRLRATCSVLLTFHAVMIFTDDLLD
jgi:hypothetical protein